MEVIVLGLVNALNFIEKKTNRLPTTFRGVPGAAILAILWIYSRWRGQSTEMVVLTRLVLYLALGD